MARPVSAPSVPAGHPLAAAFVPARLGRQTRGRCEHDLRGIVAKCSNGRYLPGEPCWIKIKNREYWRYELERESAITPVPSANSSSETLV
jgi:hypothetical protein